MSRQRRRSDFFKFHLRWPRRKWRFDSRRPKTQLVKRLRDSPRFVESRKNLPDDNNPFAEFIASAPPHEVAARVRDPRFDEAQALVLLSRAELPTALLDEIGKRR